MIIFMRMKFNNTLSYERLIELLKYNPKTGYFVRRVPIQNGRFKKGTISGGISSTGYIRISIDYKRYKAHRLAFLYMNGYWPENRIDHKDGNGKNNKWDNLREISHSCNMKNCKRRVDNKSGVKGVYRNKKNNTWISYIGINKKQKYISSNKNFNNAVKDRWDAEKKYNFSNCQTTSTAYLYLKENNLL